MSDKNEQNQSAETQKSNKPDPDKSNVPVLVAIIGGVVSIVLAILGFPPLITYLNAQWNPTPTLVSTPFWVDTPTPNASIYPSFTITPTLLSLPSEEPTFTPTSIPSANLATMKAQVVYNYGTGNAPLQASFDASSSFVRYQDGSTVDCTFGNVCTFYWDVRLGGSTIYGPVEDDSKFAYTFQKRGDYTVVVYVCRGEFCNFAAASVIVR